MDPLTLTMFALMALRDKCKAKNKPKRKNKRKPKKRTKK